MPGLAGLITKRPRQWAVAQLKLMVSTMNHEASYVSGTWDDGASGTYIGWTALRHSFASSMPITNHAKNQVLVFAGEEFSSPRPVQAASTREDPSGESQPSYLIHLANEDPAFPRVLNGRFHGILVNRGEGTSHLFNDRYGMDRLYYHESPDAFYFAAEAKAILAVVPELRQPDMRGMGEFVACGCVLQDRTLFQGLHVLPSASRWTFRNGMLESKGRYFLASEWENQEALDSDTYYEKLRDAFTKCLPRYFKGPGRVGISLTGGLDTRMIMAWSRLADQSVPTYTFGGPFRECHDVRIAREVAEVARQSYQVIDVGDDYLSRFGHYAERAVYLTDGCTAVTRGADLYANELAAQIAPIRLTGNYGSEILRRLRAFKPGTPAPDLFTPEFMGQVERATHTYSEIAGGHAVSFTAFRQAPWYQYGLLALEQTQVAIRSPFLDNDVVQVAFQAPDAAMVKKDIFEDSSDCSRLIADGDNRLSKIPTDRGLGGPKGPRGAFLRALREFSFKAEYSYDYGMPQWLAQLDHAFSGLRLERLILGRHKFTHFRVWYRDHLSQYVRDVLLDPRSLSRPYLQRRTMERMISSHLRGTANYTTEITRLLTLELQHRLFFDSKSFQ